MGFAGKIHPRPAIVALFIFAAILLLSLPVYLSAEEEEAKKDITCDMEVGARYEPSRGAKAQAGDVEIVKTEATFNYNLKAFGKLPVKLYLYNKYTGIDNTVTDVRLPSRLIELATGIETTLPFFDFDKTYFRIGLEPSFYSDSWEFTSSNFRIPSRFYAIYMPDPKWVFLCGLAVFPDTQTPFFPVLGFIYKPNDRLTFHIAPKRPNITYKLTDKISVFTEGSFSLNNEYEVKYDDTRTAVLRYYESYFGGGVGYKFNKYIQATLSVGGNFRRRLTYNDSLGKINIKDGLYTQLRVTITP
ncbi:MAG: hypothetical protein WC301_00135 [Candidatus Omnitrophota bacterium]|jgi:hypothetical protein